MGYGGKTVNGLSSLGPKMGGKAHGGGVKIEKGMGKISQSQDDVLSGKETKMENDSMGSAKMISGGHSKGKFMSTPKYKSDAQRKAVTLAKLMVANMVTKDLKRIEYQDKLRQDK